MQNQKYTEERLIRIKQVQAMTGLSRSYVYHLSSKHLFPQSLALVAGGSSRAWLESEVRGWINQRIAERDQEVGQ